MEKEPQSSSPDEKIISRCRKNLRLVMDDEDSERAKMLDDLKFCTLDQWPADVRRERENDLENGPRPCLTIDKINQYIVQVVNDMRQGKPGINVRPQDDQADVETAKILKGLVRNIEDQSNADIAYATAGESQCKIGLGYWRVIPEYVSEDSFDQELFIRPIQNTFSTYLGKHSMPDGSDAKEGWIVESMPIERFKEEFPGKKWEPDDFDDLGELSNYWRTAETVTVVEYFYFDRQRHELLFLEDGTTMTQADFAKWPAEAGPKPAINGKRGAFTEQLKWVKMSGLEVLDSRDLPGKYIPIVEVVGRESNIEGKRILWGLVRPAKDSLRMDNYIASTIVEKMALAPKTPFVGAKGQFEGMEEKWKSANRKNYSYLEYNVIDVNGNAIPPPQRQGALPMEMAMVNYRAMLREDVRNSLGMFKASVGDTESQQSGRAILALQRESDTGTYHFGANLAVSIRHTGRIIVDLIPHYYDTRRIVRVLGDDGTVQTATIDPNQDTAHQKVGMMSVFNPGVGKYDVSITVGPSYNTKRMEAAATLTEVVKSQPQLMPLIGDLLFRSLDFPYSDQIAERLKKMLPPPLQDSEGDPGAKLMQAMQQMQMMGEQMKEMKDENLMLKSGAQEKQAKVAVDAKEAETKLMLQKQQQDTEAALSRAKIETDAALAEAKATAEITLKKWVAEQETMLEGMKCEHDKKMAETKMAFEMDSKNKEREGSVEYQAMVKSDQKLDVIAQALQQMVELQQQTLADIERPKAVVIGGVQKDAQGNIIGATVRTQPVPAARMN